MYRLKSKLLTFSILLFLFMGLFGALAWQIKPAQATTGLLTYNNKYVITSTTAVTTTSTTLANDTYASQRFTLSASQTVLVIYQANNVYGASMPTGGMHNAINVDGVDYANSWQSTATSTYPARSCIFWVGTLAAGSHWVTGRFALVSGTGMATVSNRVLLIYVLNGNEYQYVDNTTYAWTNTTTLVDDTASSVTFTPSGSCVALFLYNAADNSTYPDVYSSLGKKVYINVAGTDYAEAMQSQGPNSGTDSVFTAYSASLTAVSTTVKGRFACSYSTTGNNVSINERELAVLLFDPATLSDIITSGTTMTTTSNTLVNDTQATITRTTTETKELLVVAMGDRANSVGNSIGDCYGIAVNGVDYSNSRSCPNSATATYGGSEATAWAGTISAGVNYVQGRMSNNNGTETAKITNRIVIALWLLPSGQRSPPTYSNPSASSTAAGTNCVFSDFISSSVGLSFGIFSTNNTGVWQNDSAVAFSGATSAWLNSTKTLNATVGNVVSARWFANDTSNDWSVSSFLNITVTSGSLISTSEDAFVTSGNSQSKIVKSSNGILYCTFDKLSSGQYQVYVGTSTDNGATWANILVSTLSGMGSYENDREAIAIDSNNYVYVSWRGMAAGYSYNQIWLAIYNTVSWSVPVCVSTYSGMNGSAQVSPALAVDSNKVLHIVWYGGATGYSQTQIWYSNYTAGALSSPILLSTASGMNICAQLYPAIVVDSNNNLDVDWRGNATGYTNSEIWFSQKSGGSWPTPIVISTYSGMRSNDQISPALAIDSNNVLYAGWHGPATGYTNTTIWIATYNGTWQTPIPISTYTGMTSYSQQDPAIAVDSGNRVYVFWFGEATGYSDYYKVWEATYNGAWNTPQVLHTIGQNTYPNVQWSNYPSFNIPTTQINYMFTAGTASPYNVTFSCLGVPVAANASRLVITAGAGQSVVAGQLSGPITVQRQDQYGNPVTFGSLTVTLNSTSLSATFYSDAGNTPVTSVTIVGGSSTVSFWYKDTNAGSPTLSASAVGLASATTSFTITSAPSPPTYSNISISSTFAGQPCTFSSHWSDTYGLSGYIFSTNNTGLWQNTTWTSFSGTSALASVTQNLNSNVGTVIAYNWYANNTNGLWNNTGIQTLTATDSAVGLSPFSIVSNSTVSELAFNSTSQVLEFTVSGPSGTTGFTNVTIAKTLISDISTLRVYLDGNETNYTINDLTYSWLIHFTYHHSTHKVVMDFVSQQTKTSVMPLNGVPVAIIGLVIVIFITLAITIKRKAKFPNSTKQKRSSN